ncbi:uncharacterized protein PgNI_09020, partial [Pyricularia grisea]|uniref:Uncharacterized protein n=1 Tax=Pyricularia grisea TaxID=148305 RepID=A0A6P8AW96_PYRGI
GKAGTPGKLRLFPKQSRDIIFVRPTRRWQANAHANQPCMITKYTMGSAVHATDAIRRIYNSRTRQILHIISANVRPSKSLDPSVCVPPRTRIANYPPRYSHTYLTYLGIWNLKHGFTTRSVAPADKSTSHPGSFWQVIQKSYIGYLKPPVNTYFFFYLMNS